MSKQPESFYDINRMHFIFAILAVLLLLIVGSVFMKDSKREWKNYQRDYLTYDIEKTRVKYDAAYKELQKNEDFKFLADEVAKAQEEYKKTCATEDLIQSIKDAQTKRDLSDQEYKFTKARFDAAQYAYETAANAKASDAQQKWKLLDELRQKKNALKVQVEEFDTQIKAKNAQITVCSASLNDLERKQRAVEKQVKLFERKLKKIDPAERSFINQIADMVRDLPVLDLSNPKYKIEQVVISDITDNMNLKQVAKVDRCMTCHKGILNPDFKNAPQPLTTHPDLDMFVGNNSPHPIEEFGCTVCHGGRGRGTTFNSSVHTPSSEKQEKEWREKYGWEKFHHWQEPMLTVSQTEASCFKCHSGEAWVPGAEKLNLGLHVIEKAGCYNCHVIDKYQGWPKSGPDLTKVSSKLSKEWAYKWVMDPHSFRPDTWMPAYFNQANNSDEDSKKRSEQEVLAMVEFLFAKSDSFAMTKEMSAGDAANGQKLVASIGCMACHKVDPKFSDENLSEDRLNREHGPNLVGLGTKTSKEWIYNWLKNPSRYHPETRMPDMRLTDVEARDIAAYLATSENESFAKAKIPGVNDEILNQVVFDFLSQSKTESQAKSEIAGMSQKDRLVYAGEKLVNQYGCYSCHNIKGFENAKPIGPELTKIGSMDLHKMDFGFMHIKHTKDSWLKTKVSNPRIFDTGKNKAPLEKSKMPNFNLTDEEAEAVTTALLGFVDDITVKNKKVKQTTDQLAKQAGQTIVRQFNCQSCHKIESRGGTIVDSIKDYLIKYEEKADTDAQNLSSTFSPPNLLGLGAKLQSDWLFAFLHNPAQYPVRPYLKVRMPTYGFVSTELNVLVKYFNALDGEEPFKVAGNYHMTDADLDSAKKLFSKDYFNCTQCHIVGSLMPSGSGDNLAPDLALAHQRLRPEWIIEWIKNPSAIMPGTKMPTFYDPGMFSEAGPPDIANGDENEQIRILRDYLMNISEHPPVEKKPQPTFITPVADPVQKPAAEGDFWGQ